MSLTMTGVDFGDATPSDWKTIGFDLDGKCTTGASTDVCTQVAGATKTMQADGQGGIDNAWGASMCPIFDATSGPGSCSTKLGQVIVVTDATGAGQIAIESIGGVPLVFPIHDTFVATKGSGGTLAAVAPTEAVVSAFQAVAGSISSSLCSGSAFDSIAQQIRQASDILPDGSNSPGPTCSAISIGMTFTESTPFSGPFPVTNNPCATDASAD